MRSRFGGMGEGGEGSGGDGVGGYGNGDGGLGEENHGVEMIVLKQKMWKDQGKDHAVCLLQPLFKFCSALVSMQSMQPRWAHIWVGSWRFKKLAAQKRRKGESRVLNTDASSKG